MAKNVLENCLSVWCNVLPKYLEVFDGEKKKKKHPQILVCVTNFQNVCYQIKQ